jgi:pimeloyl-ACP methyl ester carboxylesterase
LVERWIPAVLIAYGGASPPAAPAIATALAGLLPRARLAAIDGATHAMLDSHPQDVAGLIDGLCGR